MVERTLKEFESELNKEDKDDTPNEAKTSEHKQKDQNVQNLKLERREPFRGIFEVALTLLGIFSASEIALFSKTWNDPTALKFAIYPFLIMIFLWITKELYKNRYLVLNMFLGEICWVMWSGTFAYYLLFLYLVMMPPFAIIDSIFASLIGVAILFLVEIAYWLEYKDQNEFKDFYRSRKLVVIRGILDIAFLIVVYLIFLPLR